MKLHLFYEWCISSLNIYISICRNLRDQNFKHILQSYARLQAYRIFFSSEVLCGNDTKRTITLSFFRPENYLLPQTFRNAATRSFGCSTFALAHSFYLNIVVAGNMVLLQVILFYRQVLKRFLPFLLLLNFFIEYKRVHFLSIKL